MKGVPFDEWGARRLETFRLKREARKPPIVDSLPSTICVAAIRAAVPHTWPRLTQDEFARRFGFSVSAVRDWEQGRRTPEGTAQVLLALIAHDPAGVEAMIQAAIVRREVEGSSRRPASTDAAPLAP